MLIESFLSEKPADNWKTGILIFPLFPRIPSYGKLELQGIVTEILNESVAGMV